MGTSREEFGEVNIIRMMILTETNNPPICQIQQTHYDFVLSGTKNFFKRILIRQLFSFTNGPIECLILLEKLVLEGRKIE